MNGPEIAKALIRLAATLSNEIEAHYLPQDMVEAADHLAALHHAKQVLEKNNLGPLPDDVQSIMKKIEASIESRPHWGCDICGFVYPSLASEGTNPLYAPRCPACTTFLVH